MKIIGMEYLALLQFLGAIGMAVILLGIIAGIGCTIAYGIGFFGDNNWERNVNIFSYTLFRNSLGCFIVGFGIFLPAVIMMNILHS